MPTPKQNRRHRKKRVRAKRETMAPPGDRITRVLGIISTLVSKGAGAGLTLVALALLFKSAEYLNERRIVVVRFRCHRS
jgi:energy-converting hydrogenase Eha subunit H